MMVVTTVRKNILFISQVLRYFINKSCQYSGCIEVLLSPVDIIAELINQGKVDGGVYTIKLKYLILESDF
jgi:hypothetical protein